MKSMLRTLIEFDQNPDHEIHERVSKKFDQHNWLDNREKNCEGTNKCTDLILEIEIRKSSIRVA